MGEAYPYQNWADRLLPYYPVSWTNISWICPTYIARHGIISRWRPPQGRWAASYSYNFAGIVGLLWTGAPRQLKELKLGLGRLPKTETREQEVLSPSEMYVVSDARAVTEGNAVLGHMRMIPWKSTFVIRGRDLETTPPHEQSYNLLFADSHVVLGQAQRLSFSASDGEQLEPRQSTTPGGLGSTQRMGSTELTPTMKIPTGLLPFLCWICLGAAVLARPGIFVKGAGPAADRKRRLFRVGAAVFVTMLALLAAAWQLSQR